MNDYPESYDHERICNNCGVTYDDRLENCPYCNMDNRYSPDPDSMPGGHDDY